MPSSALVAAFLLLVASCPALSQPSQTLFSQAAKAAFERDFASPDLSYLLMDASGSVLAERWPRQQSAVAPGSLVKPFLAIAYAEQHGGEFPTLRCLGTRSRCWLPEGHGTIGLEEAIAQSCNAYFLALASGLDRKHAVQTFARYGLAGPAPEAKDDSLVGLGAAWKESPQALARAYLKLHAEQQSATQSRIVKGMLLSAESGTARAVDTALGKDAGLAKTGTAVCSHAPQGAADGFMLLLYPAVQPRLLLLVRVHGVTGAESARTAGAMLRTLGVGDQ